MTDKYLCHQTPGDKHSEHNWISKNSASDSTELPMGLVEKNPAAVGNLLKCVLFLVNLTSEGIFTSFEQVNHKNDAFKRDCCF